MKWPSDYINYKIDNDYLNHQLILIDSEAMTYKCNTCNVEARLFITKDNCKKIYSYNDDNLISNNLLLNCEEMQIKNLLE